MQLLPSLNDAIASEVAHCPSNFGDVVPELSDLRLQRGDIRIRLVSHDDNPLVADPHKFLYFVFPGAAAARRIRCPGNW